MARAERIEVQDARRRVQSGDALLVCAYDDESRCDRVKLDGAISLADLRARAGTLPKSQELIFFCA
ncbi:MAG: ArsR family transcriptional regulator [Candidatus Rokuibacteriota bacterium]